MVSPLLELHRAAFDGHDFVLGRIEEDARRPSVRVGVAVHQWVLSVDGTPAGLLLFDTNLARRIGVSHYVSLTALASRLVLEGRRPLEWLYRCALEQVAQDLGTAGSLGCVGEASDDRVRLFEWLGMRRLPLAYREPSEGVRWLGPDTPTKAMNLMWLPPTAAAADELQSAAADAGAAAFLLDHYGFDPTIDWVEAAVGAERDRPSPFAR